MRCLLLLSLFIGIVLTLDNTQIKGLKKLLKGLEGIYPTCELVLFSEMVDYDTADERCKSFNLGGKGAKGNLATVNDEEKNTELKLLLEMAYAHDPKNKWGNDQWVWAGLRKTKNNDGSKKSRKYNADDWHWADGSSPKDFHKWMKGQPDQRKAKDGGLQNQMRINHKGIWDDTFKIKTHPYACDYQGKYILSATHKTWSHAKEACEEAGLIFAKVRSDAEVEEIKAASEKFLGPRVDKVWDQSNWIWIGGSDADEEGTWVWVADGSPNDYADTMNWRKPNPDNADKIGEVPQSVLALSKWGEFDDSYDHKKRARPFACQCPNT